MTLGAITSEGEDAAIAKDGDLWRIGEEERMVLPLWTKGDETDEARDGEAKRCTELISGDEEGEEDEEVKVEAMLERMTEGDRLRDKEEPGMRFELRLTVALRMLERVLVGVELETRFGVE